MRHVPMTEEDMAIIAQKTARNTSVTFWYMHSNRDAKLMASFANEARYYAKHRFERLSALASCGLPEQILPVWNQKMGWVIRDMIENLLR